MELTLYERKNILETGLKSFKSHDFKSKSNHVNLNNLCNVVCISHHSGLFRTYTFSCLSAQFLQSLQSCRHVLCWQSYKHFNLCTDKCRNLQPHSWETDDTAGALVQIQVPHYFYHDSSGNLKKRQSSLLQLRKARKKPLENTSSWAGKTFWFCATHNF